MSNWAVDPSNVIARKDVAETFAESDLTLSHTKTQVAGESVEIDEQKKTTSRTGDNTSIANNGDFGVVINPNEDLKALKLKFSANASSQTNLTVERLSDSTVIYSDTNTYNAGDTVRIDKSLASGSDYAVYANNNDTAGEYDSASYPYTGTHLDIVDGWWDGRNSNNAWNFVDITGIQDAMSGTVYLEWPYPPDVYRWDAVWFQRTLDAETVQVDIQEDDGSGWTTIATDVSRGAEITAAAGSQVRFKVDLSRSSTGNNPTLDAIARRWVL